MYRNTEYQIANPLLLWGLPYFYNLENPFSSVYIDLVIVWWVQIHMNKWNRTETVSLSILCVQKYRIYLKKMYLHISVTELLPFFSILYFIENGYYVLLVLWIIWLCALDAATHTAAVDVLRKCPCLECQNVPHTGTEHMFLYNTHEPPTLEECFILLLHVQKKLKQ